ncbi:Amino acid transporter, transmembrane [Spatholobus suberectus]|nr:Amino acid transporter, transmembrane [Spatholobus suberectus]
MCTITERATAGYASMATIAYLMFGVEVRSQVTLNLSLNKVSSKIAIYTTLVNPLSKFALMMTFITDALEELLPKRYKNRVTSILVNTLLIMKPAIALSPLKQMRKKDRSMRGCLAHEVP